MKLKKFKIRRDKLEISLKLELLKDSPDLNNILRFIDEYEKDNLDTIAKLKRERKNRYQTHKWCPETNNKRSWTHN